MERKDAIYWLNNLIGNSSDYYDEALEMGIKALKAQPEIIRCGECSEWRKIHGQTYRNGDERTCCSLHCVTGRDFYCGDAERRTEQA